MDATGLISIFLAIRNIDGVITGANLQLRPVKETGDIYTITGTLVQKNADISTLRRQGRLQPGIYIINGRKIVVK